MSEHVTHSRAHPTEHEHHSSLSYWVIWAVLLVFTGLTVWTGRMDLPRFGLALAMIIATTKATLVVLFFMHLWEQKGVNRVTFAATLLFVVTLLLGVFGDILTRHPMALPKRESAPQQRYLDNGIPQDTSTSKP
jgi:cytochrome c oxidase subunit 4